MWWCHHTRTVCIHHTSVPGRWIIHGYILSCWYFEIFFFHLLWKTIKAINKCAELWITCPYTKEWQIKYACEFTSISTNHALHECVDVLDGYHLQTTTPSNKQAHNVQSYFSGPYQTYRVNIQAAGDHNCCLLFIGVARPHVMGD